MKKIMIIGICVLSLSACSSVQNHPIEKEPYRITITHDSFLDRDEITSDIYWSAQSYADNMPALMGYRVIYEKRKLTTMQLYLTKMDLSWPQYERASAKNMSVIYPSLIERKVSDSGTGATFIETIGFGIDRGYLMQMSERDWEITMQGKSGNDFFIVPAELSKALLDKMSCYEENTCL